MRRRRVSVVTCLIIVLGSLFVARQVSASPICESSLPFNIDAGFLEPDLIELLQGSPTFRQQCARIAATRVLRVPVPMSRPIMAAGRAQTPIHPYHACCTPAVAPPAITGD